MAHYLVAYNLVIHSVVTHSVVTMMLENLVIQLVKAPQLGKVKTRMQPFLTAEQALALHCHMAQHVHKNILQANISTVWLAASQLVASPWLQTLASMGGQCFLRQTEGDLGLRMADLMRLGLSQAKRVILVGSDCPFIDQPYLEQALTRLSAGCDVVFGPAHDGGYVLVGATLQQPDAMMTLSGLFDDGIAWGTDVVLQQSCQRAEQLGLAYHCLEALPDIDRPDDLALLTHVDWAPAAPNTCA